MKATTRLFLLLFLAGGIIVGCATTPSADSKDPAAKSGEKPAALGLFEPAEAKSGSQLWSENCSRCHYLRPPQAYSDAQWKLIVHHMRLRANLTGQEARSITEFLQASN